MKPFIFGTGLIKGLEHFHKLDESFMQAVVWRGDMTVDIKTVEDARIESSTDILMRLTSSAICGTDLHIYEGRMGEVNGMVIGHEPSGSTLCTSAPAPTGS